MLKKIFFYFVLFSVFSFLVISFFSRVEAKSELAQITSEPPTSSNPAEGSGLPLAAPIGNTTQSNLAKYVNIVYNLAIFLGISLTILVIIFAGYKYMSSSGDPQSMAEAKELLWGAIVGLILILITRLILVSIDSRILRFPRYNPLNSIGSFASSSAPSTSSAAPAPPD